MEETISIEEWKDNIFFFFLIDKHHNILEKAKKPHVYRGYTKQPQKRLEKQQNRVKTSPTLKWSQATPKNLTESRFPHQCTP